MRLRRRRRRCIGDARGAAVLLVLRDPNILLTEYITSESRILLIAIQTGCARSPRPAPRPRSYIVVSGGRLFWMQDAYTPASGSLCPAAILRASIHRNSVKVVIDAYTARWTLVSDPTTR